MDLLQVKELIPSQHSSAIIPPQTCQQSLLLLPVGQCVGASFPRSTWTCFSGLIGKTRRWPCLSSCGIPLSSSVFILLGSAECRSLRCLMAWANS
eukprot:scaffold147361_cov39-Prasinocladus_malaysianus.AAC.1